MASIEKKLGEWVSHGVISHDVSMRIQEYERDQPKNAWIFYSFIILGVAILALGVISLIAANWDKIPPFVRLGSNFIFLGAVGVGSVFFWQTNREIYFESSLLLFMLLCLGSIGLIAQVYHLHGETYKAILLWTAITLGLPFVSKRIVVPLFWVGALLTGLLFCGSPIKTQHFSLSLESIFILEPLLCAALAIATALWPGSLHLSRAFQAWSLITGVCALILMRALSPSAILDVYFLVDILAGLTAMLVWLLSPYKRLQKTFLSIALVCFAFPNHLRFFDISSFLFELLYTFSNVFYFTAMAFFFASLPSRRLFQTFVFFAGLQFFVFYVFVSGGLQATGISLIFASILILGLAVLWHRYRERLFVRAKEWLP